MDTTSAHASRAPAGFNLPEFILKYELEGMDLPEEVEGFGRLLETGAIWHLPGAYARRAAALIDAGYLSVVGQVLVAR